MGPLDNDRNAVRPKHPIQSVSDLRCNSLLNLHAPGIDVDDPCQFGDTDNPVAADSS
jgi:hypothetical protein